MAFADGALDDDLVACIASYGTPEDLLSLALTCRRLGSKYGAATRREWRLMARAAKRQKTSLREWSLAEEAARSAMEESQTEEERACLPLRDGESWIARYNELLLLRRPLTFDQLLGDGIVANQDKSEVRIDEGFHPRMTCYCTALSNHIMRAGKHYATFTMTTTHCSIMVGVFRPTQGVDLEGMPTYLELLEEINERWDDGEANFCALNCFDSSGCYSAREDDVIGFYWRGEEEIQQNDVVGILLDVDEGTMTVYNNGRRLGLLTYGLVGEYCWGVNIAYHSGESVKICREAIPA